MGHQLRLFRPELNAVDLTPGLLFSCLDAEHIAKEALPHSSVLSKTGVSLETLERDGAERRDWCRASTRADGACAPESPMRVEISGRPHTPAHAVVLRRQVG